MNTCHFFYKLDDGVFDGRTFSSSDHEALKLNTPQGYGSRSDVSDWQSQRVDVATGKLVDWQPPRPDADHFWDPKTRRWLINPIVSERRLRESQLLTEIKSIDERLIRPMLEIQANPEDVDSIQIRDTLRSQKDKLRAELRSLRESM